MSFGAGAITLKRMRILDVQEKITVAYLAEKLHAHRIDPIFIGDAREESMGWCHPFSGEPDFSSPHDLVFGDYFVFGLRSDTKKIPGTLFRIQMKAALEALSNKFDAEVKQKKAGKISKQMRDAARDRIRSELLTHTLPSVKLIEVGWHLQTNEIWIASASQNVLNLVDKLFAETFALPLVQLNPGTLSVEFARLGKDKDYNLDALFDLIPSDLLHHQSSSDFVQPNVTESQPF